MAMLREMIITLKHIHKWEWTPFWHRFTCKCNEAQDMTCKAQEEMEPCDCDIKYGGVTC